MQRQTASSTQSKIDALNYNTLGNQAYENKNYTRAQALFLLATKYDPELPKAHYNLALTYSILKEKERAKIFFKESIKLAEAQNEPSVIEEAYYELSKIEYYENHFNEAIDFSLNAIKVRPIESNEKKFDGKGRYYFRIGKCQFKLNVHELAKSNFENALKDEMLKSDPEYSEAYFYLAAIHDIRNDYQKAVEYYIKAIEINPNDHRYHFNLGRVLEHQKKWFLATKHYYIAHQFNSENPEYREKLKSALSMQEKSGIFSGIQLLAKEEQIRWLTDAFDKTTLLGERFNELEMAKIFSSLFSNNSDKPELITEMKEHYKAITQERVEFSNASRIIFSAMKQSHSPFFLIPPEVTKKIIKHIPNELPESIKDKILASKFKRPGQ